MAALRKSPELRQRFESIMREIDALAGDRKRGFILIGPALFQIERSGRTIPKQARLRDDFVTQFAGLVANLARYQIELWNLHIDYFDRKS